MATMDETITSAIFSQYKAGNTGVSAERMININLKYLYSSGSSLNYAFSNPFVSDTCFWKLFKGF